MAGRRTRRASQAFQPTKISEDEFTSGDKFVFAVDSPSPKGRVTRSRRSSICLNPAPKPSSKRRRQTMMPVLDETQKSPSKSSKPKIVDHLLTTPSKAIGDFYSSPLKQAGTNTVSNTSPVKHITSVTSASPTKKFSKSSNRTLTETEILESLDMNDESGEDSPVNSKKVKGLNTKKSKIPVRSPPTKETNGKLPTVKSSKVTKVKVSEAKKKSVLPKPVVLTPKKSGKVSLKDLPPGSPLLDAIFKDVRKVEVRLTPLKIKEDPNVIFDLLEEFQDSKMRIEKVVNEIVKQKEANTPKTRLNTSNNTSAEITISHQNEDASPILKKGRSKSKAIKKVTSDSSKNTNPTKPEESACNALTTDQKKVTVKKATLSKPAITDDLSSKSNKSQKPEEKKTSPAANKGRSKKQTNKKDDSAVTDSRATDKAKKDASKSVKKSAKETGPTNTKKSKQVDKSVASDSKSMKTGKKRALETNSTAVQNKRIKLEVQSPEPTPKKVVGKKLSPKSKKTPKVVVKEEPITPNTEKLVKDEPKSATPRVKSTSKKPVKKTPAAKSKTPKLTDQYKQKTPVGSLKKPLKRLAAAQSTPAQVKPSDLLKKNLKKQVETAITAKIGSKPDSSPYLMTSDENSKGSPVFTKVETITKKSVKRHITGTPARIKPVRKFGTVIQPASLLEDSVIPSSAAVRKVVSSSTPLKPSAFNCDNNIEPHPLEAVEATPIRAPTNQEPVSPQPMMVTGGLAKMCNIM